MKKENTKAPGRGRMGFRGAPVFWQYFVLMAVILVLATAIQLFTTAGYSRAMTESYLRQAETSFRQRCEDFYDMLYAPYTVPRTVEDSEAYAKLQQLRMGDYPESASSLILNGLAANVRQTLALTGTSGLTEYFFFLPGADAVVTQDRVFGQADACFDSYICVDAMDAGAMREYLQGPGLIRILPQTRVTVNGRESFCTLVVISPYDTSGILGLLYPQEEILSVFDMNSLPEGTFLTVTNSTGGVLATTGGLVPESGYEFSQTVRGINCQVTMTIPREYFSGLVSRHRNYSALLLSVTLLLGLGLCVLFSNMWAKPLKKLLEAYGLEESTAASRNEIHRLANLLASTRLEFDTAKQTLTDALFVRVLSGGVLTEREEEKLLQSYPAFSESCRIAIIHSTATSEEFGQTAVTELVAEHLPEHFAAATVNNLETGILLKDDPDSIHELARVLSGINSQLVVDGLSVLCGVSAGFSGVHSAYAAVRQARFSIPIRETSYLEVYSQETAGDERPGVFSWLTHERLYQAIMKQDREGTVQFIRTLAADKYYSAADAKEVFYNVRFVVRSTANEMRLPLPEADTLEYREEMRTKENFLLLEDLAITLFDRLLTRQERDANTTLDNVVVYLAENFRNPDLSANTVATHFALPVKVVYAAVREKTGMNLGEFLISVRMKEAARLLCTTQQPVDEVAAECGYPAQSTFYRVFKKYYGESPNKYRSIH